MEIIRGNLASENVFHADLDATASGNTQLVAAVTGKKIVVVSYLVTNEGSATIKVNFQSATTELTGSHMLATDGGGHARNESSRGYYETVAGEALNFNLSATGTVAVTIEYVLRD